MAPTVASDSVSASCESELDGLERSARREAPRGWGESCFIRLAMGESSVVVGVLASKLLSVSARPLRFNDWGLGPEEDGVAARFGGGVSSLEVEADACLAWSCSSSGCGRDIVD